MSTAGAAALGLYSGSLLGLIGTMMPCNRTLVGGRCVLSGVGVGGALGLTMGGLIGGQNTGAVEARLESAGIGALVGAAVGVGLRSAVRQYGWADVGAAGALGAAIGAAPYGSLLGAGAGAATGALVWLLFPRAGISDFAMFTLVGTAVGGMIDWGHGAATAKRDPGVSPTFVIRLR